MYNFSFYGKNMSLQVTTLNRDLPEYDIKANHHTVKILEYFNSSNNKDEEYYAIEILHTQQIVAVPASFINPITTMSLLPVIITVHYISRIEAELTIMLPTDEENNLHPLLVNESYIVGDYTLSKRWGEYDEKSNKRVVKYINTLDDPTYCLEHELLPALKKKVAQYVGDLKYILTTVKNENSLPPDEVVEFEI